MHPFRTRFFTSSLLLVGSFLWLLLSGCATPPESPGNWMDYVSAPSTETATESNPSYDLSQTRSDLKKVNALTAGLRELDTDMTRFRSQFTFSPNQLEKENQEAELMLLRYVQTRDSLHDILKFYKTHEGNSSEVHTRGAILAMSAWINIAYIDSRFASLFYGQKKLTTLFNTEHPRFELPADLYSQSVTTTTNHDNEKRLLLAWALLMDEMQDADGAVAKLLKGDSAYGDLIDQLYTTVPDTQIQTDYLRFAQTHGVSDFSNWIKHSDVDKVTKDLKKHAGKGAYKTRGVVFERVARIKTPSYQLASFSAEQVAEIKSKLQPGDILLSYTAGYMSDVFLPGKFKHGITYIGSVEQRRQAGLTDAALSAAAVSDKQREQLLKRVRVTTTDKGDPVDVIEAVSEGVIFNSIEYLLATHINRLLVLRPKLTPKERQEQLITLLQYVGTEYDFKFDFLDDSKQCCTELVYRCVNGKGGIDFPLSKFRKLWILDADGIANYATFTNPDSFEFILLTTTSSKADGYKGIINEGDEGQKVLKALLTEKN